VYTVCCDAEIGKIYTVVWYLDQGGICNIVVIR
jgi:hypothetical protein